MLWGLGLIVLGLFEKVVLADGGLANAADKVFAAKGAVGFVDAWLGTLAFSGQIFCDFAGYSTIAIGTALCLGFALPENFRMPYAAIGFSDFWRRWHISLSTWLRDYLYIPLGGSRGTEVRTYVNLMLTMLLGGLWHGASWTFVVWGGLHGLYLAAERWLREKTGVAGDPASGWSRLALALVTYTLVNVTWVFFRAEDFAGAARILQGMAGLAGEAAPILPTLFVVKVVVIVTAIVTTQWLMRNRTLEDVVAKTPWWLTRRRLRRHAVRGDHHAGQRPGVHLLPVLGPAMTHYHEQDDVTVREIPRLRYAAIGWVVLALFLAAMTAWELKMRALGLMAGDIDDSPVAWAIERKRLETGEHDSVVIVGSSRILFDTDLAVWKEMTGRLPVQLALPGTSPRQYLRSVANDTDFSGLVICDVTPEMFFSPFVGALPQFVGHGDSPGGITRRRSNSATRSACGWSACSPSWNPSTRCSG